MPTDRISFQDDTITLSISINRESSEHTLRVQCGSNTATLNAHDAQKFLQWLYQQRDTLYTLTHEGIAIQDVEPNYKCMYPGCSQGIPAGLFLANSGYCDEHKEEREEGRHARNVS